MSENYLDKSTIKHKIIVILSKQLMNHFFLE